MRISSNLLEYPGEWRTAMNGDYLTLREAQEALGVSNYTIWRMVKEGRLAVHTTELDRRKKLVKREDVERLKKVRPAPPT